MPKKINKALLELITVEFCPAQGAYHVDTFKKYLSRNQRAFAEDRLHKMPNYCLLDLFNTKEEANAFIKILRNRMGEVDRNYVGLLRLKEKQKSK